MKCEFCGIDVQDFRTPCVDDFTKHRFKYDAEILLGGKQYPCDSLTLGMPWPAKDSCVSNQSDPDLDPLQDPQLGIDLMNGKHVTFSAPLDMDKILGLPEEETTDYDPEFIGQSIVVPWRWPKRDIKRPALKRHCAQGWREFKVLGTKAKRVGDIDHVTLSLGLCQFPDTTILN